MAVRRRLQGEQLNAWPGYVDALSTLLMVIIFVLLVFVLAQAFLSVALSGRDRALDRVNRQMAELTDMLSLERGRTKELQLSVAQLNSDLRTANMERDTLSQQLTALRADSERVGAERDALRAERDRLSARLADSDLQAQSARTRTEQLQGQLAELARRGDLADQTAARLDAARRDAARVAASDAAELAARQKTLDDTTQQLAAARSQLADAQHQLAEMREQAAAFDRTVAADRDTIQARLSDLAKMADQVRALTALRDELERQAQDAAVRATTAEQRQQATAVELANEKRFGDSARAQIALLTQQTDQLKAQLASVAATLELARTAAQDKDVQITDLTSKLNVALARKVEELQRYRSDFFGKLREVLANRPGIQVVGDRFVFQSEVLFPVGSADLTPAGQDQIRALAATLKQIATEIPADVNWLMRVDGHADRQPLSAGRFASNWELSAARAITVVKLLIAEGVPPERLAATGFADYQPLDPADTPEAYAKNRRIEIRLTDR